MSTSIEVGSFMTKKRVCLIPAAVVLSGVIIACGWSIGTMFGRAHARHKATAHESIRANAVLQRSTGIRIGEEFPNLDLWSADGEEGLTLAELLPDGGSILYVSPTCGACVQASLAFGDWFQEQRSRGNTRVIITDDLRATPEFARTLHDSLSTTQIYCDVTQSLRREYGMTENPAFFLVAEHSLKLERAGVWAETVGFIYSEL